MNSILNELKRRSVFRAAAAYSVVAWVIAQAMAVVLPAFQAPDWVLRIGIIVLLAGLPLTLLIAWIYELTPQGLQRTSNIASADVEDRTPRVLDSIIIVGLVIAVIFTGLVRDAFTDGADWLIRTTAAPTTNEQVVPRLAVLPFHSANTDIESERFSHGLAADIFLGLQGLDGIVVVGMASTEALETQPMERRAIADMLDTDLILEGTVRRNSNSVKIDVQLIDSIDSSEVLTLSFTPSSSELYDVRNEILAAVAKELGGDIQEASEAFLLKPVYAEWLTILGHIRHASAEDLVAARSQAAQLAERAPGAGVLRAAQAYALVAGSLPDGAEDYSGKVDQARRLLDEAMTLSPNSLLVLQWRADVDSRLSYWRGSSSDHSRILTGLRHALELYPSGGELMTVLARHAERFGDYPMAVEYALRALIRNPRSAELHGVLVESLAAQGRFKEARDALSKIGDGEQAQALRQRLELGIAFKAGDTTRALDALAAMKPSGNEFLTEQIRVLAALGRTVELQERLTSLDGENANDWREAWAAALRGEYDTVFSVARRVLNASEPADARRLGIIAIQAGDAQAALEIFSPHFIAWLEGNGPLRGSAALETAPWLAYALRAVGREADANRVLDRHLAGVLLVETELAPAWRDLLLAENFIVRGREQEAMERVSAAVNNGFDLSWGVYCEFVPLPQTELLKKLHGSDAMMQLSERIEARAIELRPDV